MRSAYPSPPADWSRGSLRRRAAALAIAIAIHLLLLLLLIQLAPRVTLPAPHPAGGLSVIAVSDDPSPAASPKPAAAKAAPPAAPSAAPVAPPPPIVPMPAPLVQNAPLNLIHIGRADLDATDQALRAAPRAAQSADAGDAADSGPSGGGGGGATDAMVGKGPHGEPLYAAQWRVRPTQAELSYYAPHNASGWGIIACRTVPDYRVEDCVELDQSPPGSGLSRAVRQAAWQFRVMPPRVGGRRLVGEWVSIRIDYTITPAR